MNEEFQETDTIKWIILRYKLLSRLSLRTWRCYLVTGFPPCLKYSWNPAPTQTGSGCVSACMIPPFNALLSLKIKKINCKEHDCISSLQRKVLWVVSKTRKELYRCSLFTILIYRIFALLASLILITTHGWQLFWHRVLPALNCWYTLDLGVPHS